MPIGNPQNLVIIIQSRISFVKFFVGVAPTMLVGVVINVAILLCMFWNQLSLPKDGEEQGKELEAVVTEDEVISHTFSPDEEDGAQSYGEEEVEEKKEEEEEEEVVVVVVVVVEKKKKEEEEEE
ncbi:transporter arsB [Canna indica]|uniref:Transporter arsB n=1 Tax=Canna indica TaxID=4628 RepID=A0AAQ3JYJ5_9LILI|nr:transporter arsB [Canna indica]